MARDLAAYLRSRGSEVRVQLPDVSAFAVDDRELPVTVRVEHAEACPRYVGVTVKGCKIGPSPEWMQNCLRAAGINPKNNLVDITNFVLFELGQPLHAFDASKIEGREVVVRTCAAGTPFVTLDGTERKLTDEDLMICSAERPMCIAGVFGGLDSGIGETTTDVFIESAYFNPVWVRKTAKRFGLNTDASFRFERGIDPNMQVYAAKRAALLFKELAGGTISSDLTDFYPAPIADFTFDVSLARVNALIGKELPEETVRTILEALEITILAEHDGVLTVAVPPYRVDVRREADLIEEILRIYGYNNVEIPARVKSTLSPCAAARPRQTDQPRRRLPHRQRLHGDHVQLADESLLLRRARKLSGRPLRADPQSVEHRPERHAPDAAVPHARGNRAQRQPQERRPEALRTGQLLLLRRGETHARTAAFGLHRGVPARHRHDGTRRARLVERTACQGLVLHAARHRREAPAPLRHRHLRPQERAAAQRSLRRRPPPSHSTARSCCASVRSAPRSAAARA